MAPPNYTADFLAVTLDFSHCPWLRFAVQEARAGVREDLRPGRSNSRVNEYLRTVNLSDDETPWCSAFANWCMGQAGLTGSGRANARSWMTWGGPVVGCRLGSVAVFRRGNSSWRGHVGFYVGDCLDQGETSMLVMGGNQDDSVCVKPYPYSRLLGLRWPAGG
jgi:uncharacterized protein (TIGR02594 family)